MGEVFFLAYEKQLLLLTLIFSSKLNQTSQFIKISTFKKSTLEEKLARQMGYKS